MPSLSFPPDFEKRMREQLGEEWSLFEQAHSGNVPVSIRINPKKQNATALSAYADKNEGMGWSEHGYYLKERPSFTLDPLFHAGAYYVQEASSMLVEQAIKQITNTNTPIRVLDLCAAPGGKSTHLLSLLPGNSLLVSNEVIRARASILAENVLKWGHSNAVVSNNDPHDFQRLKGFFDVVLVDAPCSGEGLFRKDTDARNEWSPENANLCSLRQRRILEDVWPALKEDGYLIYCTCTYNAEENENNLKRFAEEHGAVPIELSLDESWGVAAVGSGGIKGYQCYPHQVKGEGFFLSVLQKKEHQVSVRLRSTKNIFSKPVKLTSEYTQWLTDPSQVFLQFRDYLLAFPEILKHEIEFVASQLKIVSAGTTVGTIKHAKLIPDHSLAMSVYLAKNEFSIIQVSKEDALTFLRRDNFWRDGLAKGFSIIEFEGTPLGFVNVLDNRMNNLYPAEWRIRMASP
jgi:16S rRNA C967 or C1407 C5-methylase (RsmB/RsmF family)/NOL1/NOP2/fmu family ribosome biogenesis protein